MAGEIQWNPDSYFAKEMKKFDTPKSQGGYNCNGFEPYPRMLYKAQRHPISNQWSVGETKDILSLDGRSVLFSAQMFSTTCQLTVKDEEMEARAIKDGWRKSMAEAMEYREQEVNREAKAAAERNYAERNMSEGAKREIAKAEASTPNQLAEIPEQRKRKPLSEEHKAAMAAGRAKAKAAKQSAS